MTPADRSAVKAGQQQMVSFGKDVVVDGVPGPQTAGAYRSLTSPQQSSVREVVTALSPNGLALIISGAGATVSLDSSWYSEEDVRRMIVEALQVIGTPPGLADPVDHFLKKAGIEARTQFVGGVRYYWALSSHGSYKGLFQMGQAAYSDVLRRFGNFPDFGTVATDARWNTRAAVAYAHVLISQMRAAGYRGPISSSLLYLAHNQGAGGALTALRTGELKGQQSKAAYAELVAARANQVT